MTHENCAQYDQQMVTIIISISKGKGMLSQFRRWRFKIGIKRVSSGIGIHYNPPLQGASLTLVKRETGVNPVLPLQR